MPRRLGAAVGPESSALGNRQVRTPRYNSDVATQERLVQFGARLRVIRLSIGLPQRGLAKRIRRSQGFVSLVEHGRVTRLSIAEADAICDALGATLILGVEAPILVAGARQRDAAHARCVAYVARRLASDGWIVRREVMIGPRDRPGWIDILAFDPASSVLLVIEIKTELVDIGGLERQLGWYQREARRACRDLDWAPNAVVPCALVLSTGSNDDRMRANAESLRQVFPLRWRDLIRVIRRKGPAGGGWALAVIDPRSRVHDWCRPTVLDGRRSAPPYARLGDFMRAR
jgi:transcriptional regulator with XRE-family HTH domain